MYSSFLENERNDTLTRKSTTGTRAHYNLEEGVYAHLGLLKNTGRNFFYDNGLFLAMGLAFNLLLYFIPLALLMIALLSYTVFDSERAMMEVQSVVR